MGRQTYGQTDIWADRQTDKTTGSMTYSLTDGQTNRLKGRHKQTDSHPPIHIQMAKNFDAFFDTCHFIIFTLLAPFKKDKIFVLLRKVFC
jgi:hypothetical protein